MKYFTFNYIMQSHSQTCAMDKLYAMAIHLLNVWVELIVRKEKSQKNSRTSVTKKVISHPNFTLRVFPFKEIPWSLMHFLILPTTLACTPETIFRGPPQLRRHGLFNIVHVMKKGCLNDPVHCEFLPDDQLTHIESTNIHYTILLQVFFSNIFHYRNQRFRHLYTQMFNCKFADSFSECVLFSTPTVTSDQRHRVVILTTPG